MIRSYRYPLRPTRAQEAVLVAWLGACCDLYNGALQERRDAWRKQGRSVGLYDQTKSLTEIRRTDPAWAAVPVQVTRSALRRLDRAMKAFFRRCKAGQKPGFPRFRAKRRYDSFSFLGPLRVEGGRVHISKLGPVKFHEYRPLKGKVLDVIVRREATGRWYVVFQVDLGAAPLAVEPRSTVGIDVGLRTLAALSTGEMVENPRHGEAAARQLAARQRDLARKRKGSQSRRRAVVLVAKAHAKVQNQRIDHARKVAADLYNRFDAIAVEDLSISRMVHGNLAKAIHDASWGTLLHAMACKAESAGKILVKVDPWGTSQKCSGCGAAVPKDLSVRVHHCDRCGLTLDRDVNAARNIEALGRSALRLPVTPPVTSEGQQDITGQR